MAGGLVGLLDDVAALAKLAAASVDDIGAAAGRASVKAAGVVVDDTAVTPTYVQGLAAERELPIIKTIAIGSLRNKLLFILPVAILLSQVLPTLVEVILIAGGAYLCYEGAHKITHVFGPHHASEVPAAAKGPDAEKATISSAIRTDFILSAEIMVISLREVIDEPLASRIAILVVVALAITVLVYGVVAAIVKMDDVGLALAQRRSARTQRVGRTLVAAMPIVLRWLSRIGIAAMLWVGGHIIVVGLHELGWHWPADVLHTLEGIGGSNGVLVWLVDTAASAVVGLVVGLAVVGVVALVTSRTGRTRRTGHGEASASKV
ncbi:MAG: DUF808 domain-containing protein [Acidimicrobiales bacterium]